MEIFMFSTKTPALASIALLAMAFASPSRAADGDLDPGFGTAGIAYLTPDLVAAQELQPYATIVLPDGKLLFAGSLDQPTGVPFEQQYRGMLARFNADGTVDTSFGNTSVPGVVALPNLVPGNRIEGIESAQRLDDGSLVAVGTSLVNGPLNGFVVKLDAEGNLDAAFGGGTGMVLLPSTHAHAVAIDSQGRIIVAGEHVASSVYTGIVMRFEATGSPDSGFGSGGTASIEWDGAGNSGYLADLIMGDDDGVVVGGMYDVYGDGLGSDFAIARLDSTGTLDPAFGDNGWRVFHDPADASMSNGIQRLAATPDGSIAFAGFYYILDTSSTALIVGHLGADGSTDMSFGDASTPGYFRPAIVPTAQSVNVTDLVAQPDGKLLVTAGYYAFPDKENFLAIRTTAAGQLDPSFADAGVFDSDLAPDGAYSEAETMALQPDGRIVLAGRAQLSSDFLVSLGVVRLLNGVSEPADRIFADGFEP
jgi:uncharacterized delta-60 repeat protein